MCLLWGQMARGTLYEDDVLIMGVCNKKLTVRVYDDDVITLGANDNR